MYNIPNYFSNPLVLDARVEECVETVVPYSYDVIVTQVRSIC